MHLLQKISLLVAPVLASSMITALPSKAATEASSIGLFDFTEFSQSPSGTFTDSITNTFTDSRNGRVFANAFGNAQFIVDPANASNFSSASAMGELGSYLGLAEAESTVIGRFDIEANTSFSFNFTSNLILQTSIDNATREQARSAGEIVLALLDIDNDNAILDAFAVASNLETPGNNDFIVYDATDNIFLNSPTTIQEFGTNQELALADINGSYQREFKDPTNLALVEIKFNRAEVVAVPEPGVSNTLVVVVGFGVICFKIKTKSKLSA